MVVTIGLSAPLGGCYYWQAARGQVQLLSAREPIAEVVADAQTPMAIRDKLRLSQRARVFAHTQLALPNNGSYTSFVDLQRDYVVVNVFAAPEFSLDPKTWCYLFIGCLAYRGYFDEQAALRYASKLSEQGFDAITGKVPAYSTLGRFQDPVLSTMLNRSDEGLVALLFHELAHQVVYVDGDTGFNESFASFVASEGLRLWRRQHALDSGEGAASDRAQAARTRALRQRRRELIDSVRDQLGEIYISERADSAKRTAKAQVFTQLAQDWVAAGLSGGAPSNNAALVPVSLYDDLTPAFARVFVRCEQSFECFYAQVIALGEISDRAARREALAAAQLLPDPR